ncbi:MAG: Crp/Fnr family transcriptional regulator [Chitinophagaceae bacterium]
MNELFQYLNSIYPLSESLQQQLTISLKTITIPRKGFLLKKGQVCKNICFVEKGLFRCFYIKDDKEISSWFMKEGDVIISVESYFKQKPSYESIQALEDCQVLCVGYDALQSIYHSYPEFNYIARVLTERYYCLSEQRLFSLRMQRASERYHHLMNHFPEIIQRVPSTFIASYLGITLETLSRIKHVI